jgi:hypothetical protein
VAASGFKSEQRTVHDGDHLEICLQEETPPAGAAP